MWDKLPPPLCRRALLLILVIGAACRLLVLAVYPDQGFPDAAAYMDAARQIVDTGMIRRPDTMPLYPLMIVATGLSESGIRLLDIALSVASLWLIFALVRDVFRHDGAALLAAAGAAVYPHFVFYSVSGLTETAHLFLTLAAFLLLYRERYAWAAAALVASILARPVFDYLAPVLILAFALVVHRRPALFALKKLGVYGLVYVLMLGPWWVHNHARDGQFLRLALGEGHVWYSGNNPMNRSGGGIGMVDFDPTPFQHYTDPYERDQAMKAEAIRFIRENPDRFVELAALKFIRLWQPWPYAPEYRNWTYVVLSLATYGVAMVLALAGLVLFGRRYWRELTPMILLAGYITAVHMVLIASIRYRLPVEPFILMLAAVALTHMLERWRIQKLRTEP